jgi:hypothetical protein
MCARRPRGFRALALCAKGSCLKDHIEAPASDEAQACRVTPPSLPQVARSSSLQHSRRWSEALRAIPPEWPAATMLARTKGFPYAQ